MPAVAPLAPVEELVERYRRYLLVERALTVGTARVYVEAIRPFVTGLDGGDRIELERITAAEVTAFVLGEANRRPGTSIRSVATASRSMLSWIGSSSTAPDTPAGVVTSASKNAHGAPTGHSHGTRPA